MTKQLSYLAIVILPLLYSQLVFSNEADLKAIALSDLATPITTDAKYILLAGSVLTSIVVLNKEDFSEKAARRVEHKPPLGNYGYVGEAIGWGYLNAVYALSHIGLGYYKKDKEFYEKAELMLDASFYTLLTTVSLKTVVKARRPEYPDESDSFPSGHASMAFAFASVVTAEYGWGWGVPSYTIASFISLSRVNDGRHWAHDIIAGATIGASYGWGVYWNHRKKNMPFMFSFVPIDSLESGYVRLTYKF